MKIPVINGISLNTIEDVQEALREHCGDDEEVMDRAVIFSDFIPAIIGFSEDNRVVYDYDKMVQWLSECNDMTEHEARDYIEFNTLGSLNLGNNPGEPIIMYGLDGYED